MNKIIFFLLFFLGLIVNLFAQQKTTNNFYILPQVNLLNGNSHVSVANNVELGMQYKMMQFGINTSIDYYKFRSAPITAQVRHFLNKQKNKPFVYAGIGYNFAWLLEKEKMQTGFSWWGGGVNEFANYKGGLAYNFGIGYQLQNAKQKGVVLSLGFNSKSLSEKYTEWVFDGVTSLEMPRSNIYTLNRISFGVGYMF